LADVNEDAGNNPTHGLASASDTEFTEGGDNMIRRWLLCLTVLLSGFIGQYGSAADETPLPGPDEKTEAAAKGGITLEELIILAESHSPTLRQAAAAVEAARGTAVQVGLYPNPQLLGGANQIVGNQSQYYAALSQEIVTMHKLQLNRSAATQAVIQAEQEFVLTRFQLLTNVRQGYMMALAAQRRNEVLIRLVEIATKSMQAAERLQQAGEGTRTDTLLFEIEVEKAEVAVENSEARMKATRRELAAIIGIRDMDIGRINGNLLESLDQIAQQVLLDGYVPFNASVQIAQLEIEKSKFLIRRAEVEPYPNVTVYAGYQRQIEPALHNMGLLTLSLPIPLWNQNQGNICSAYANLSKAYADVDTVQNTISKQMADAGGRYRISDQQAQRFERKIVPKAREGVKIIQEGFSQGQFDFLRLLQAQRILVESNLGFIDALETRWGAAADMAGLAQIEQFP
jgi:cobalt-zinc-cadmium efflux system outer membrane protein